MDYEQKYKEILEWARKNKARLNGVPIEDVLPELAVSEDERIRKAIIGLIEELQRSDKYFAGVELTDMIAYLEKHKEPHYANKRVDDIMNMPELSAFEQALTNFIGYWEDDEEHWPSQFVKKHGKHILDMAREELEKEQKPSEDLEEAAEELFKTIEVKEHENIFDDTFKKIFFAGAKWEKEHKPTDTPLMNGDADLYFDEWNQQQHNPTKRQCFEEGIRYAQRLQKEHRPVSYSPLCNTIKDKIREYIANNFVTDTIVNTDVKSIVKAMEEGVRLGKEEQKPIDYDAELKKCKDNPLYFYDKYVSIKLKSEWSDEDSDNLERVDNYLWMLDDYVGDDCTMPQGKTDKIRGNIQEVLSPWLKSLPKRFNLQPKEEWSEEDEKRVKQLIYDTEAIRAGYEKRKESLGDDFNDELIKDCDEQINWLKSLRPSWKPSEEEERLINTTISFLKDFADKGYENAVECIDWLKSKLNGNTCK